MVQRNRPYRDVTGRRGYRSNDPFVLWLYRDPRRTAALSVLFTVGSILVTTLMVFVVLVYLAIFLF